MQHFTFGSRAIPQKDIKTAILEAQRNGFGVLEMHFSSPQVLPERFSATKLKQVQRFAIEHGVALHTHSEIGQSMVKVDAVLRKADQQKLKDMVHFCRAIDAKTLTIHIGRGPTYHF